MNFPKQEINIDSYLQEIATLLENESCHLFIDTNIISQLYRLNENARNDFYDWVDSCNDRFHIPCWSVLEYSKRVTTHNTGDYLSELIQAKSVLKELERINRFVKGYVGESLLIGSAYAGKKDELFSDIDEATKKFEKVAMAINKNLTQHQQSVHKEVLDKLQQFTLKSDIYEILRNIGSECELRFHCEVAPGYKDSYKSSNRFGDMIIWNEIINYCKELDNSDIRAIFITRDRKLDMAYRPIKQTRQNNPNVHDIDKIGIAQESLVYEFKLATKSENFYLIDFYTLVKILSSDYRELATSFQIATQSENVTLIDESENTDNSGIANIESLIELIDIEVKETVQREDKTSEVGSAAIVYSEYSGSALADSKYDITKGLLQVNECIEKLKSHNWYLQNPAINKLTELTFSSVPETHDNIDAFFVLGRNILQSADGTSGSAIHFIENLVFHLLDWPVKLKKAFIDGCLYEVFFDSMGKIRPKSFKASYFETLVNQVNNIDINCPFKFINTELEQKSDGRFVPVVNSDTRYTFEFSFNKKSEIDPYRTKTLKINGINVSETFKKDYEYKFCDVENLKNNLSGYYAIPIQYIEIKEIPNDLKYVYYIHEHVDTESLPF